MGRLYCGAARTLITPSEELLPNLPSFDSAPFGGVLDDIYLRVIAMDNGEQKALIISFDLDKAPNPDPWIGELAVHTGIAEEFILYFGIHVHSSVITSKRPFEKSHDISRKPPEVQKAAAKYEEWLKEKLFDAVDRALHEMKPARMGFGLGNSYINVNRNQDYFEYNDAGGKMLAPGIGANGSAPTDTELAVMRIEDLESRPIAFFMNYAVHCVVMIWNRDEDGKTWISGDIGGGVSRYMEQKFPGSIAVWSSGAAGDLNPIMMNQIYYPEPQTGICTCKRLQGLEVCSVMLKTLTARHFQDVMKVVSGIKCTEEMIQISGMIEWSETPGCQRVFDESGRYVRELTGEDQPPYRIRLHLLRIGSVALFGVNGELYSSLGKAVKNMALMKNTVVINHDASLVPGNPGYIYDDETIERVCCMDGVAAPERIPGTRNFRARKGDTLPSLRIHIKNMFEHVL
ncbi:MAG: hypothetical protein LUH19_07615 [Lachnospiraceae bacterium]|nr:hypothetical protein [Lachnospiraceae bacterium]